MVLNRVEAEWKKRLRSKLSINQKEEEKGKKRGARQAYNGTAMHPCDGLLCILVKAGVI